MLSNADAAYVAGWVDADGSIYVGRRRTGGSLYSLTFSSRDQEALQHVRQVLGHGSLSMRGDAWRLSVQGRRSVCASLELVLPYLRTQVARQRALALLEEARQPPAVCVARGCTAAPAVRSLCRRHYQRVLRAGRISGAIGRGGSVCAVCGTRLEHALQADHGPAGGPMFDNMVVLCADCHAVVDEPPSGFRTATPKPTAG